MLNYPRQPRQHLNADALIDTLRERFAMLPDARVQPTVTLADALLSGFALFALKDPSLLAFDQRRQEPNANLHTVYGIGHLPCDSQLRDILDPVDPELLRPCFTDRFRQLQRGQALERLAFYQGHYLLSFDGSGYYSSSKIHCPHCLEKHHRNGTVTYHHQMLAAVLVHPDLRAVIPLMPEPILKQDGATKHDCEGNAAKRFFAAFRRDHPCLPILATGDGLTANAPLIRDLGRHHIRYLLGVKPGDHAYLLGQLEDGVASGQTPVVTGWNATSKTLQHFRGLNQVALNEANPEVLVNVVEYGEIQDNHVTFHGSWVTDLEVSETTLEPVRLGGRARWKIENETFNTLKNQGYQFEHNFGHGEQHLSVVFGVLMLLAFLSDQIQQLCCTLFQAAWQKAGSKRQLWDEMRHLFHAFAFGSMRALYEALLRGFVKQQPVLLDDS